MTIRASRDTTAMLVERLIDEDEVDFLLGPYSSTLTRAAIEVAEERDLVLVEGSGSSETLFEQSYRNLFAVLTPAVSYTESALRALADKGASSVAISVRGRPFSGQRSQWRGAVGRGEYGMEVLAVEAYPQDGVDAAGNSVRGSSLWSRTCFLVGGYFNDAVLFVRTAKELDFNPKATVMTVRADGPEAGGGSGRGLGLLDRPDAVGTVYEAGRPIFRLRGGLRGEIPVQMGSPSRLPVGQRHGRGAGAATGYRVRGFSGAGRRKSRPSRHGRDHLLRPDTVSTRRGRIRSSLWGAVQVQNGERLVVAPGDSAVAELIYPAPNWKDRLGGCYDGVACSIDRQAAQRNQQVRVEGER